MAFIVTILGSAPLFVADAISKSDIVRIHSTMTIRLKRNDNFYSSPLSLTPSLALEMRIALHFSAALLACWTLSSSLIAFL